MPTRKTAKSAAKPLAKKVAKAKKPKSASKKPSENPDEVIVNAFVEAITSGSMDGYLELIDDALEQRSRAANEISTPAKKTPAAKKVSAPPKRDSKAKSITLTPGQTYTIADSVKSLAGAKVKFHNFKADSMEKKSVIEMLTDKPGNPKGKKVIVPTVALVEFKAPRKGRK